MKINVNKKAVGSRIKQIRTSKGYTLESFGKLFGASKSNVQKWETGFTLPNKERLASISKIADITVNELVYGSVDEFIDNNLSNLHEYETGKNITSPEQYSIAKQQFKEWLTKRNISLENITYIYDYIDQNTKTENVFSFNINFLETLNNIKSSTSENTYFLVFLIEMLTEKDKNKLENYIFTLLKNYKLTENIREIIDNLKNKKHQ